MIVATACLTINECGSVTKNALWAFIVFVTLLTTALAPSFLVGVQVLIHCYLVLLVFISLFNNSLNHFNTFGKVFI
jgi:hypothetical protein